MGGSSRKMRELCKDGIQVIMTTHSPSFIDLSKPGRTVFVRKHGEGLPTRVIQLKPPELAGAVQTMGADSTLTDNKVGSYFENSATPDIKSGLFARACILVEGQSERVALDSYLQKVDTELVRLGIAVLPVGGLQNIARWVRYFRAHEIPVFPIFDTDSDKTGKKASECAAARTDIYTSLGLSNPEQSSEESDEPVQPIAVNGQFATFDPHFEGALESLFGQAYADLAVTARKELGDAKPIVSRYVSDLIQLNDAADHSLRQLAKAVEALVENLDRSSTSTTSEEGSGL